MLKPYDPKDLAEKLKAQGIEVAEEGAKAAFEAVWAWVGESAQLSASQIDDLIWGLAQPAKPYILEQLEKINPNG